jgi:8-oxo-dGTP pyrophosphatase MutT (NUDIX family)
VTLDNREMLRKVSIFAFSSRLHGWLLVFEHPSAGTQVPAGTVDVEEEVLWGAQRELFEESGLDVDRTRFREVACSRNQLPVNEYVALRDLELTQLVGAARSTYKITRGTRVRKMGEVPGGLAEIVYEERDSTTGAVTLGAAGRVAEASLGGAIERHHFVVYVDPKECVGPTWEHAADRHVFRYRWVEISTKPELFGEQALWLESVMKHIQDRARV